MPLPNHFKVVIDGFGELAFQTVDGLKQTIGTEDYKEGGENTFTHRLPSRSTFEKLTLKRQMVTDSVGKPLTEWFEDGLNFFGFDPKTVTVSLLLVPGGPPIAQWVFVQAWPISWSIDKLDAQASNALLYDTIELSYQYFYRVKL